MKLQQAIFAKCIHMHTCKIMGHIYKVNLSSQVSWETRVLSQLNLEVTINNLTLINIDSLAIANIITVMYLEIMDKLGKILDRIYIMVRRWANEPYTSC
jgi:hypothetical protein